MTHLSKYIAREYLRPFLASMAILSILILLADFLEHLDKFMASEASGFLIVQYLLALLPFRSVEILPVSALLAALFCLGTLSRQNEITAMLSGGISPWNCLKPVLFLGLGLVCCSYALSEWVSPITNSHAKKLWKLDIKHYGSLRQIRFENLTVAGQDGYFFSIGVLDLDKNQMTKFVADRFEDGVLRNQWSAESVEWKGNVWYLNNGVERSFDQEGMEIVSQTPFDVKVLHFKESIKDLVPHNLDSDEMTYKDFNRHLRRLRVLGVNTRRQEVELHLKLAFPWTSFVVILIGIPFGFQKRSGKVRAIGVALLTAFFYFGLMQFGRAIGQKDWCPPLMGAWMANIIFGTVGIVFFSRMMKRS
ncbi:MAG TPA: LptF/LptG family permease [Elusimicrobiota bacterium]|nr:LptF/LptG family permease [Elusimicrobiota bacterium]